MRSIFSFALPLGSAGLPGFLGFGWAGIAKLLNDECPDSRNGRQGGMDMQHGYRIAIRPGVMYPCIDFIGLGMAFQVEHFHDAIPDRPALKHFFDRYALCVRCGAAVQLVLSTFAM